MSDEKYVGAIAAAKNVLLTKAALDKKLDNTGGTITGSLKVDGLINAGNSLDVKSDIDAGGYIHSGLALLAPSLGLNNEAEGASVFINCSGDNAARITSLSSDGKSRYARLAVGIPTGDNDAATKAYVDSKSAVATASANGLMSAADKVKLDGVEAGANKTTVDDTMSGTSKNPVQNKVIKQFVDDHAADDAVLYTAQTLTSEQRNRARLNIAAVSTAEPVTTGTVSMCPSKITDSYQAVHVKPTNDSGEDFTATLWGGPENAPVRVKGIRTPTDADTDAAANVKYVKAKIAEVAASGGVDVDNALSATSTNPVQNKVVTAALTGKAGTAVATQSINGLMSKADKTKLDGIAAGATKITIDSTMSGSSNNPVANHVVKQYVDDKVAAAGSNITVDATLSGTSTNPVQNKAIKAALDGKASTAAATTSAAGLMSAADKAKLDGIASGATKVTVDSAVSASSTNPVQNKAIKTAIDAKADKAALDGKLDKSGGTLTGNLTGKYITGTWLQTTDATDLGRVPGKIAVLDESGWVYYRTPAELLADLGADYIVSQGTTGSWTWRKWHSGIAEMWAIFEATSLDVNNAWGSVYYGTWMGVAANKAGRKYPFAFKGTPVVIATPYSPSTDFWLLTDSTNNVGTPRTYAPAYACVLPRSATITGPQIHYHVIGKYK